MGTAVTSLLLVASLIWKQEQPATIYLLSGSLFYLIGSRRITIVFNVPMNKALDKVEPESAEGADLWARYLTNWTAWNHVRTVACFLGTASFILALG